MKSIIAIDYDDTYSKYSEIFDTLRQSFQAIGALVYIVTARASSSTITDHDLSAFDDVIYTDGKAKASIVDADIYIDDNPVTLCCDLNLSRGQLIAVPAQDLHQNYQNESYDWHWSPIFEGFTSEKRIPHTCEHCTYYRIDRGNLRCYCAVVDTAMEPLPTDTCPAWSQK